MGIQTNNGQGDVCYCRGKHWRNDASILLILVRGEKKEERRKKKEEHWRNDASILLLVWGVNI